MTQFVLSVFKVEVNLTGSSKYDRSDPRQYNVAGSGVCELANKRIPKGVTSEACISILVVTENKIMNLKKAKYVSIKLLLWLSRFSYLIIKM